MYIITLQIKCLPLSFCHYRSFKLNYENKGYLERMFCKVNPTDEVQSSTHDVENEREDTQGCHWLHSEIRSFTIKKNKYLVKIISI